MQESLPQTPLREFMELPPKQTPSWSFTPQTSALWVSLYRGLVEFSLFSGAHINMVFSSNLFTDNKLNLANGNKVK